MKFTDWLEFVEDEWFEFKELVPTCYEICRVLDSQLKIEYTNKLTELYINFHYLFNNHSIEEFKHNKKRFKKDWNKCINSYSKLLVFEEMVVTLGNEGFKIPERLWRQFRRFKELHLNKEKGYWNDLKHGSNIVSEQEQIEKKVV
ncbi:hypothetical protein FOL75_05025 [Bacillus thuringiensis]|uniref:hypothetical protein n=1 Tax=Bacillus thuringiensis TaxID=1428 RepID=UPI002853D82B|nr:hypothetical protein [Bacillus thuringiensis]MDR5021430.1 hypothetical protein [Bacillus thuringiensis]